MYSQKDRYNQSIPVGYTKSKFLSITTQKINWWLQKFSTPCILLIYEWL